jgi:hypothetical protein
VCFKDLLGHLDLESVIEGEEREKLQVSKFRDLDEEPLDEGTAK